MDKLPEHKNFDTFLEQKLIRGEFPVLMQFPKEFKRSWVNQFDARFIIILAITFFAGISFIVSFLWWGAGKWIGLDITSIQKRYAQLLLAQTIDNDFFNIESKKTATYLYGVRDYIQNRETSILSREQSDNSLIGTAKNNRGGNSAGSRSNVYAKSGQSDFEGTTGVYGSGSAERIGSMGILGYLSENNNTSNEELSQIFGQGGRSTQHLEGSLADVKIANFGQRGGKAGSGTEVSGASFTGIKGSKSTVSKREVQASLMPLEPADYNIVAKNIELEESSISVFKKTGKKATARKAEDISRVVLNHNQAIQDCYKQALKKQPDLVGKVVVRFSITPNGKINLVEVITSTIDCEPMMNCIIERIRRWNDFGESDISLGTVSYRQAYLFGY